MKTILILAVILSLSACSKKLPEYPKELNKIHMILMPDIPMTPETESFIVNVDDLPRSVKQVTCMEFDVVQVNPYQFDYKGVVDLKECHEVSGYKADENIKLWNWVDDVFRKADENKCFK